MEGQEKASDCIVLKIKEVYKLKMNANYLFS